MAGYGYIHERTPEDEPSAKPQVTSYADVTLSLLIIFLVSVSASLEMVDVELPKAEHTVSRDTNLAVTVSISKNAPKLKEEKKPGAVAAAVAAAAAEVKPPAEPKPGEKTDKDKAPKDPWKFYFEDDATGIEARNLWTALKAIKGDSAWALALVRADKDTPCEHVAILIQCLQGLGADEIAFVIKTEGQAD